MSARALFLTLLVGAAGGALAAWAVGAWTDRTATADATTAHTIQPVPRADPDPEPEPGPMLAGSPPATPTESAWREAMEQRFARIEARLEKIAERPAPSEEEAETIDLGALDDDALTARASSLYAFKNYAGTLAAFEALLARDPDLDMEAKGRILSTMAQCHRALGNLKQADEVYLQIEDLHGEGTAGAMTARYHRAWLKHAHNDLEGARSFMRQVATSDSSPPFWRLFSRANAADFGIRLGDTANAQADLEEFKRELEGDDSPTGQRVRAYVNQLLESLEE